MLEIIDFVKENGSAFGYTLNMDKSIYLMAPPVNPLNDLQWNTRIKLLTDRGILRENIRLHPNCQPEKK